MCHSPTRFTTGICESWRTNRHGSTVVNRVSSLGGQSMARNYKELQARMNPTILADNRQRVREELQRMALEELRSASQLTQTAIAEMLDVPQSSISRIERHADMYLTT